MIREVPQRKRTQPEVVGSRNAVETAIDLSKVDRHSTWEGVAARMRGVIKPWEATVRSQDEA